MIACSGMALVYSRLEGSHNGPKAEGHFSCPKSIPRAYHYKQLLTYLFQGLTLNHRFNQASMGFN